MMTQLRFIWDSFVRSAIRYWDGKFIRSNEVEYLRSQLELERQRYESLVRMINTPKIASDDKDDEDVDWKPISTFKPIHIQRQELEAASRRRAAELKAEAETALNRSKTTEQLESELGIKH